MDNPPVDTTKLDKIITEGAVYAARMKVVVERAAVEAKTQQAVFSDHRMALETMRMDFERAAMTLPGSPDEVQSRLTPFAERMEKYARDVEKRLRSLIKLKNEVQGFSRGIKKASDNLKSEISRVDKAMKGPSEKTATAGKVVAAWEKVYLEANTIVSSLSSVEQPVARSIESSRKAAKILRDDRNFIGDAAAVVWSNLKTLVRFAAIGAVAYAVYISGLVNHLDTIWGVIKGSMAFSMAVPKMVLEHTGVLA